jgi:hypothetical protein
MKGQQNAAAKAKAISQLKKELLIVLVGVVVAAAVVLIGGSGALNVLRWIVAALILILVVTARVVRAWQTRERDPVKRRDERAEEAWRGEQEERYEARRP